MRSKFLDKGFNLKTKENSDFYEQRIISNQDSSKRIKIWIN